MKKILGFEKIGASLNSVAIPERTGVLLPQIDARNSDSSEICDRRGAKRSLAKSMQTVVVWVVFRYPLAKRSLDLRVE